MPAIKRVYENTANSCTMVTRISSIGLDILPRDNTVMRFLWWSCDPYCFARMASTRIRGGTQC